MPQLFAAAPRFIAQDDRGRYVRLDQLTNKIVVLEWFDPNNDYTRRDTRAGTNRKLAAKYKEKGVAWLAVNSTRLSDVSFNHRWAETHKLGYPVLDDGHLILAKQYGVTTAPFYFILDRHGHVAYEGPLDEDENRALVQQPRDGRRNWIDRALGQLIKGQVVDRPLPRVYGDPLNQ
jgi:peroxiredoxin